MPSHEYGQLVGNVASLRQKFLDFSKRVNGNYSKSELMDCRAFIAFSHAEVEHYLEAIATKILDRVESTWVKKKKASKAIAALMTYRLAKGISLPDDPKQPLSKNRLDTLIGKAFATHRSAIMGNHGIKPANISELFIPLGMMPDDIKVTLMIQLKNFGIQRGALIHSSSQVSLPKVRDPFDDELADVLFLVTELKKFDDTAKNLA